MRVCLSFSFCMSLFHPLLDLSEYIIVSRVVSQFEYWNFYTITLSRSWFFDEVFLFYRCWSCFTTVVDVVDHSFIMQDGKLFVRLGYGMVYQVWLLERWRVVWILGVGKVCKGNRNVGFFVFEDICFHCSDLRRKFIIRIVVLLTQIAVVSSFAFKKNSDQWTCGTSRSS